MARFLLTARVTLTDEMLATLTDDVVRPSAYALGYIDEIAEATGIPASGTLYRVRWYNGLVGLRTIFREDELVSLPDPRIEPHGSGVRDTETGTVWVRSQPIERGTVEGPGDFAVPTPHDVSAPLPHERPEFSPVDAVLGFMEDESERRSALLDVAEFAPVPLDENPYHANDDSVWHEGM